MATLLIDNHVMSNQDLTVSEFLTTFRYMTEQFPSLEGDEIPDHLALNEIKKCAVPCTTMIDLEQGGGVKGYARMLYNQEAHALLHNAQPWVMSINPGPLIAPLQINNSNTTIGQ